MKAIQTERQKDRKTERQKDRKTERQKDRKTERQKDRKTERQKDRKTVILTEYFTRVTRMAIKIFKLPNKYLQYWKNHLSFDDGKIFANVT